MTAFRPDAGRDVGAAVVEAAAPIMPQAAVPQSTAKPRATERKVPQSTASSVAGFAVLDIDDLDDAGDFAPFAVLDAKEWRIETRERVRQDGKTIIYWNYRRRKIHRDANGNRRIEYRKGGHRVK